LSVGICLPPKVVDKFRQALISGKINPERLANMSSEARHKLFSDIVGEGQAKFVNSNFEEKMLLKDQQRGYLTWAKKLTGVTPEAKRDLISRITRMDKFLNPTEEKAFLKDLASTKLGIDVTAKEAKTIATMSQKLQEFEAKKRPDGTFASNDTRLEYGRTKYDMGTYVSDLKNRAETPTVKESILHPVQSSGRAAGVIKAISASLDDSAVFRQGWKTLWTNPIIWQRNARASFKNLAKVGIQNKDVVREVMADIISRPNYDKYAKMKLAIGNIEEQFPTGLPGKVPILGRAYKASEQAYEAFLYKTRADVADKMLRVAEKSGVNTADKTQLSSIGKLINSLTGRGDIGYGKQASPLVNNFFFSIRFVKSNFDTLTAHQLQKDVTPFVRKQAAKNLTKVVAGTAAVMAIANFLKPGSVELDPRSKKFGKFKVGDTTFDMTGGMNGLATLAAQLITNSEKSSGGIIKPFGTGYGAKTGVDAINNFFENKTSPAAGIVRDLIKRQDFNGNPITLKGEAKSLLPMPISTQIEAHNDPHSAHALLIALADGLGISANTNNPKKNLKNNLTKSDKAFLDKIGDAKFQEYNDKYDVRVNKYLSSSYYERSI
jgi:hypothetical protein